MCLPRIWFFWALVLVVGLGSLCHCITKKNRHGQGVARTVEATFRDLIRTAQDKSSDRLFDLLDTESRWSIMSLVKDQKTICELVKSYYPQNLQARELTRCQLAAQSKDVKAYFAAYVKANRLLVPLDHLGEIEATQREGDRMEVKSQGQRLVFCKEGQTWGYCGLRADLDRQKIKAARDLFTVKENVETFKGR